MTGLGFHVPGPLLATAVPAAVLGAVITLLLGWHALRRLLKIPRFPRPLGMYVALSTLWVVLVTITLAAAGVILLLRDHRSVDGRTRLAEVRCQPVRTDHLQVELVSSPSEAPERHDLAGDACVIWVEQLEVRPGFAILGVRALSRIDRVGDAAVAAGNPESLSPRGFVARFLARRLTDLVVRRSEAVRVTIPADAQRRVVVVSSGVGPTLEHTSS